VKYPSPTRDASAPAPISDQLVDQWRENRSTGLRFTPSNEEGEAERVARAHKSAKGPFLKPVFHMSPDRVPQKSKPVRDVASPKHTLPTPPMPKKAPTQFKAAPHLVNDGRHVSERGSTRASTSARGEGSVLKPLPRSGGLPG